MQTISIQQKLHAECKQLLLLLTKKTRGTVCVLTLNLTSASKNKNLLITFASLRVRILKVLKLCNLYHKLCERNQPPILLFLLLLVPPNYQKT